MMETLLYAVLCFLAMSCLFGGSEGEATTFFILAAVVFMVLL
jgi:hypothetical protein